MSWKAHQQSRKIRPLHDQRRPGIEPGFGETGQQIAARIEPLMGLRDAIHDRRIHAERLASFAQCATWTVRRHGGRQRRAIAPILAIDVLHDFLAALVLEIDVYVRRLTSLFRDEPLEQHRRARRIHLGHAKGKAHGRVGRRPAPLAKDALAAREPDNVVDGEEVRLVTQVPDQREFVFDLQLHLMGDASRPAAMRTNVGLLPQIGRRRMAVWHQLVGIFIAQLVERKRAQVRDPQCLLKHALRIQVGESQARSQMLLGAA